MSAGQKVRHLLANNFEVSILNQFLRTLKSTITTSFTSRQLATSNEILVARTKFSVALATRKAQFQTLCICSDIGPGAYRGRSEPSDERGGAGGGGGFSPDFKVTGRNHSSRP